MRCDNIEEAHDCVEIGEDHDALQVYCRNCEESYRIGKVQGVPNSKEYGEYFFTFAVQPPHPIFYKTHAYRMNV